MSALDALPGQFDNLLKGIGTEYSLEELRYAFRQVIYSGALKLYTDHPEIIIGPPPPPPQQQQQQQQQQPQQPQQPQQLQGGRGPHTDGQLPPYRPNAICTWVCIALGN